MSTRPRILLLAALVTAGAATVTSAHAAWHKPTMRATTSDATDVLWSEIQALLAGGVAPGDPKVAMLEDDLSRLEAGELQPARPEPGVDLGPVLGAPHRGGTRSADLGLTTDVAWDDGVVECEPVPPDVLTAAEIAHARCVSAPQPDGSSRYVAIDLQGTVRVVRFSTDGAVSRAPDLHADLPGVRLDDADLTVARSGDVVVVVDGNPSTTIDIR